MADMRPAASLPTVVVGDAVECVPKGIMLHSADDDEAVLSQADVAVITASTIVNGTFAEVVRYAIRPAFAVSMDQAPGCCQTSFSTAGSMRSCPSPSAILRSLSATWSTSRTAFSLCLFHGANRNL